MRGSWNKWPEKKRRVFWASSFSGYDSCCLSSCASCPSWLKGLSTRRARSTSGRDVSRRLISLRLKSPRPYVWFLFFLYYRLRSTAFFNRFFAVKSQGVHQRAVVHREKDRVRARFIAVAVLRPERHGERVAFRPVETLVADDRESLPSERVIDRRARVAVRSRRLAGTEHLDLARERRQRRPAGERIDVAQQQAVERIAGIFSQRLQCFLGVLPAV